jgi:hypothetical protein
MSAIEVEKAQEAFVRILSYGWCYVVVPVILIAILRYAWELSKASRPAKMGFYLGVVFWVWMIGLHVAGIIPIRTAMELKPTFGIVLIGYTLPAMVVGGGILFLMDSVPNRVVSSLIVGIITATSLACLYLYFFYETIREPLFAIAPGVLMGSFLYQGILGKKKE